MTYGSPIDNTIMHYYLCSLSNTDPTIKFLDTNFHRDFVKHGWDVAHRKHFLHENSSRHSKHTNFKPTLYSPIILIPIHVHQSHWVILTWRIIGERILFLFADDLNSSNIEESIHLLYSSTTTTQFYPSNSTWIFCWSYTYRPHSNECSPCSLLAGTIMSLNPNPSRDIIIPFMHSNIGQISRWWVASSIISNHVNISIFQNIFARSGDYVTFPSLHMEAYPYNLPLHSLKDDKCSPEISTSDFIDNHASKKSYSSNSSPVSSTRSQQFCKSTYSPNPTLLNNTIKGEWSEVFPTIC